MPTAHTSTGRRNRRANRQKEDRGIAVVRAQLPMRSCAVSLIGRKGRSRPLATASGKTLR